MHHLPGTGSTVIEASRTATSKLFFVLGKGPAILLILLIALTLTLAAPLPSRAQDIEDESFAALLPSDSVSPGRRIQQLMACNLTGLQILPGNLLTGKASNQSLERALLQGLLTTWTRKADDLADQIQNDSQALRNLETIKGLMEAEKLVEASAPGAGLQDYSQPLDPRLYETAALMADTAEGALEKPLGALATQTSEMMVGSVSVVVLYPESDGSYEQSTENWTEQAITDSKTMVAQAMGFFSEMNPQAGLSFVYDYPSAPASGTPDSTVRCGYEPISRNNFDETYINDMMTRLGYTSGTASDRLRNLAEAKRNYLETDWAIVVIVKNNANAGGGRASAFINGPAACVFADSQSIVLSHETAHLFGALDEYHPDASQSPTSMSGYLYMVNGNSQYNDGTGYNDGAGEGRPSLMVNLTGTLSPYTWAQIGWTDSNGDGIPDVRDTTPAVTLNSPSGSNPVTLTGTATASTLASVSRNALAMNKIASVLWRVKGRTWLQATASDGEFNSQTEAFTISIEDLPAGTYEIQVMARNSSGFSSPVPAVKSITIDSSTVTDRKPFASFSLFPETGSTATSFRASAWTTTDLETDSLSLKYRWDWESDGTWDTTYSSDPVAYHTFTTAGQKQVTLQVKDASENTVTASTTITVTASQGPPRPSFTVTTGAQAFGTTQPLFSFDASTSWDPDSGSSNLKYRWDWENDGTWDTDLTTEAKAQHRYTQPTARISRQHDLQEIGDTGYDLCSLGSGRVAAASYNGGIKIWNVSTPATPNIEKTIACSGAIALDHYSGYLYVACQSSGMVCIDVDPLESSFQATSFSGTFNDLIVSGTKLYCAAGGEGVKIFDLTTPASPQLLSTFPISSTARSLALAEPYLMVGTDDGNLKILDCTNTSSPSLAGQVFSGTSNMPQGMALYDNTLYMGFGTGGLVIFDITTKSAPVKSTTLTAPQAKRMAISGTTLFAATDTRLTAWDISTPGAPVFLGSTGQVYAVAPMADGTAGSNIVYCGLSYYNLGVYRFHADSPVESNLWRVKLLVQDTQGNSATCERSVWSCPYDHAPAVSFTVSPEKGSTLTNFLFDSTASQDQDSANSWDGLLMTRWDYDGDGNFDTGFSASNSTRYHQYTRPGVYSAVCEVRDRFRAISRLVKTVLVSSTGTGSAPVPAVTLTPTGTVQPGTQLTLDASATTDPDTSSENLTFSWDLNYDGVFEVIGSDRASITYTPSLPGNYLALLRVSDNDGLWTDYPVTFTVAESTSGPVTSISSPSDGAVIPNLSQILGTYSDSQYTITKVEVLLTNGTNYLSSTGWVSTETWVTATLPSPGQWLLDLSSVTLAENYSYLVRSRATNTQGTVESPKPGINFVVSTSGGPATSCSTPALTDSSSLSVAVTSSDENATVRLWYKKDTDTAWIDSTLTRSGSGTITFTLPSTGKWNFYTTGSLDGSSEAAPATADSSTLYRDDMPLARIVRLTYTSVASTWFQLNEIQLYGTSSLDAAVLKPVQGVTVSSAAFGSYTEARLIDGSITYNSDFVVQNPTLPLTVTLTLSDSIFLDHIVHYNDGAYGAKSVTVELSKSGTSGPWTQFGVYDGLTLTAGQPNADTLEQQTRVVINEVYPGSPGFVEIRNSGASMVDITNWKLNIGALSYTFGSMSLKGGGILVLREGEGTSTATTLFTGLDFPWTFGGSGSLWLADSGGIAVDFLRWGTDTTTVPSGTQWTGANPEAPGTGKSLGRLSGASDTDAGSDWTIMNPTSGTSNTTSDTFTISGYVKDENSEPMSSVTITFTGGGQASTDSNGFYVMTGLTAGTYTATPSSTGSQFSPTSSSATVGPDRTDLNFTASPANGSRSLSGKITLSGSGLADVTVTVQGVGSVKTSSTGYYYMTGLTPGVYSIVPGRTGYTFTPVSISSNLSLASAVNQNFTALAGGTGYTISGHIRTTTGQGIQGVSVEAGGKSVLSDSAGFYLLYGLTAGTYTVTPVSADHVFNPPSRSATISANLENIDFAGLDNTILSRRLQARYVKIRYRDFNDTNWFQLNEITFYGRAATLTGGTVEALTPSAITCSVDPWTGYGTDKLKDKIITTNGDFALKRTGISEVELIFDMGAQMEIDRLIHVNDGAFGAKGLEILTSNTSPTALFDSIESFTGLTITSGAPGMNLLSFSTGKVLVNEVDPQAQGFVELKNTGHTVVDLAGWVISGGGITSTFPQTILAPGDFLLFRGGRGTNTSQEIYANTDFVWLPTVQGDVSLKDETGRGSDFMKWGASIVLPPDGTTWTTPNPAAPGTGYTLCRSTDSVDTNAGSDFTAMTATPLADNVPSRKLSGTIAYSTGTAAAGVSIEISGHGSVLTDSQGKFSVNLSPGDYFLIPMKTGLQFTPVTRSVTLGSSDLTGQNFSAQGGATRYVVCGYTKDSDSNSLSEVSVTAGAVTVKSNSQGFWYITDLAAGTYTLTPARYGYTFTPPSTQVTLGPSQAGVNFSAQGQAVNEGVIVDLEGGSSGDGTAQNPFNTITAAINVSAAGSTITIRPGTYNESFTLKQGQILIGSSPHTTIINGQGAQNVVTMAADSSMKKLTVTGSSTLSGSCGIRTQNSNASITNVIVRGNADGLSVKGGNITALNCVFHGNTGSGILLETGGRADLDSCVVSSITQNGGSAPTVNYCDLVAGGYGVNLGTGNISSDPVFLSEQTGDYRLSSASPCVNSGNPDSTRKDTDSTRNDMGAFGGSDPGDILHLLQPIGIYATSDGISGYGKEHLADGIKAYNSDFAIRTPSSSYEIIFDFGKDVKVSRIQLYNDGEYGLKRVVIAGAAEGTSTQYNVLGTFANLALPQGRPGKNILTFTESTCRYFKVIADESARSDWLQLNEIEFYSTQAQETGQDTGITPANTTCTPAPYSGYGTDRLFDGSIVYNSEFALRNPTSPVTLLLDFGRAVDITTLVIHNDGEFGATSVRVLHSLTDDDTYTEKGFYTSLTTQTGRVNRNELALGTLNCRFLKLQFESFGDQSWFQMAEIEVLGSQGSMEKITVQSATSSVTAFTGYGPEKLINGTSVANGEFACRNNSAQVALTLDLGSDRTFNRIDHFNDGIYGGKALQIATALNASPSDFTNLQSVTLTATGSQALLQSIALPDTTARYIRFTYTTFGDPNWFQICEIVVYREAAEASVLALAQDSDSAGYCAAPACPVWPVTPPAEAARISEPETNMTGQASGSAGLLRCALILSENQAEKTERRVVPELIANASPGWALVKMSLDQVASGLDWTPELVIMDSTDIPHSGTASIILRLWKAQGTEIIPNCSTDAMEALADCLVKERASSAMAGSILVLDPDSQEALMENLIDTGAAVFRQLTLAGGKMAVRGIIRPIEDCQWLTARFSTLADIAVARDHSGLPALFLDSVEELRASVLCQESTDTKADKALSILDRISELYPELSAPAAETLRAVFLEALNNRR